MDKRLETKTAAWLGGLTIIFKFWDPLFFFSFTAPLYRCRNSNKKVSTKRVGIHSVCFVTKLKIIEIINNFGSVQQACPALPPDRY